MFILYAVPIGLLVGWLRGGRLDALARLRVRFGPVVLAALLVQLVVFSSLGAVMPDALARSLYVASTAAVVLVVVANARLTGAGLIAAGAVANLAAIIANGGAMPADPAALAAAGVTMGDRSNSIVVAEPALRPLTDVFALPAAIPLANVFSVGDLLIAIGVAVALAAAMRKRPNVTPDPGPRNQSTRPDESRTTRRARGA